MENPRLLLPPFVSGNPNERRAPMIGRPEIFFILKHKPLKQSSPAKKGRPIVIDRSPTLTSTISTASFTSDNVPATAEALI